MKVTIKGEAVHLLGEQPSVGSQAPDFTLVNLNKKIIQLSDLQDQPVIISVVPDIDTRVCQLQTKRFNQEAAALEGVHFLTISNNTKEEQANWCAAEGISMEMLHDGDNRFGELYGLVIKETGRLARSIFVIDQKRKVAYAEIVSEVAMEPDYESALAAAKSLA